MANGRGNGRKGDSGRDSGGFAAVPWSVFDSPAYALLSHPAKALLMEFARQFVRDNNGRLLCSMAHLGPRGWRSNDVITRAVRELVATGFVHQTVQGQRPNKASWYAVTWRALDRHPGYDIGAAESFERGSYRKNAPLTPSPGVAKPSIAPSPGVGPPLTAPSPGAMETIFTPASTPSPGDHLEKPSAGAKQRQHSTSKEATMNTQTPTTTDQPEAIETLTDLWAKVGIRSMAPPKVGRAGAALDDKTAARLSVARTAQAAAIARHTTKPAPPVATAANHEHSIDRTEAQDLHAWSE